MGASALSSSGPVLPEDVRKDCNQQTMPKRETLGRHFLLGIGWKYEFQFAWLKNPSGRCQEVVVIWTLPVPWVLASLGQVPCFLGHSICVTLAVMFYSAAGAFAGYEPANRAARERPGFEVLETWRLYHNGKSFRTWAFALLPMGSQVTERNETWELSKWLANAVAE